ncbi:MAG: hypothetical protein AAFQ96_01185, partial [Pseudomonadota bacterium]
IRRARIGDAGEMAAIYRPHVETGAASFEQIAPDGDEMARRIAARRLTMVLRPANACALRAIRFCFLTLARVRRKKRWR